jgi:hypothetical protein
VKPVVKPQMNTDAHRCTQIGRGQAFIFGELIVGVSMRHTWLVPCLVVRSLSDMADAAAPVALEKFAPVAAANSVRFVRAPLAEPGK